MSESIGGGLPTNIPSLADSADIQDAFKYFHYGSIDVPTYSEIVAVSNSNVAGNGSLAGYIKGLQAQIDTKAPLASPVFTGTVSVTTITASTNVNANTVTANTVNTVNVISSSNVIAADVNATSMVTNSLVANVSNLTTLNSNVVSVNNISVNTNVNATMVNTANISASYISSGVLDSTTANVSGVLNASNVVSTTGNITTVNANVLSTVNISATTANIGTVNATTLIGSGSGITALNATAISSGTIDIARIPTSSITSTGNVTSGTWTSTIGAVSGANLTSLNANNISSGTLANARTTGNVNSTANTLVLRDTTGSFNANVVNATAVNSFSGKFNYMTGDGACTLSISANSITLDAGYLSGLFRVTSETISLGGGYANANSINIDNTNRLMSIYYPTSYITHTVGDNSTKLATTAYVDRGYRYLGTVAYTANTSNINLAAVGSFNGIVRAVRFRVLGAGGGGGSCADAGSGTVGMGGAGGGGAYVETAITPLTSITSNSVTITIGAGGTGAALGADGTAGGQTSIKNVALTTTYVYANGGGGGLADTAATPPRISIPAAGGTVNTAAGTGTLTRDFYASGQSGGTGAMPLATIAIGGAGGENHLYRSYYTTSKAIIATSNGYAAGASTVYQEYGIGGTGGVVISGAGSGATGGNGAQGIAFVDFYA